MGLFRALRTRLGMRKTRDRDLPWPWPGIEIGRYTYGIDRRKLVGYRAEDKPLIVGSFCSIANDVSFMMRGDHWVDRVSTFPLHRISRRKEAEDTFSRGRIVVGHDVWIGRGAIVMAGVTIGNGAVIGAATVVTKDVPAYAVFAGNPGQVVKFRFDAETIAGLQEIEWWNWSEDRLQRDIALLRLSGPELVAHFKEMSARRD